MDSLNTFTRYLELMYLILLIHQSLASIEITPSNSHTVSPDWQSCLAHSTSSSSFQCKASPNDGGSPGVWSTFADEYPSLPKNYGTTSIKRSSFPPNFTFGTSSSSYQYEGAVNEGGRSPSIWDIYTQKYLEKIKDRSNGAVAVDSYHRFKQDVNIMKDIGFDAYRFSISWTRILPAENTMCLIS